MTIKELLELKIKKVHAASCLKRDILRWPHYRYLKRQKSWKEFLKFLYSIQGKLDERIGEKNTDITLHYKLNDSIKK